MTTVDNGSIVGLSSQSMINGFRFRQRLFLVGRNQSGTRCQQSRLAAHRVRDGTLHTGLSLHSALGARGAIIIIRTAAQSNNCGRFPYPHRILNFQGYRKQRAV